MTVGILSTQFYLIDNWPGEVTNGPNPSSWTTASATEDFPLGTKRMIYDDTNSGWSILMYLKFKNGAVPEPDTGIGKFPLCGMHTAAAASGDYFVVNNDMTEVAKTGPMAISLSTNFSADTYPYGWFWVGGVCPQDACAELNDAAFRTDGTVTAQSWMVMASTASYCSFHLATATDVSSFSAFSLVTDASS
jgi:hypothetical protein